MGSSVVTVAIAIAALLLGACSPASSPASTASSPPSASGLPTAAVATTADPAVTCPDGDDALLWPDSADLRYAPYAGGPDHAAFLRGAAEAYGSQQDLDVGVVSGNFYGAPVPGDLTGRLTGTPPADVLTAFVGGVLRACAERGLLLPLDDLWADRGWAEALPPAVADLATVDDRHWWAPTTVQWNPIFYRTDVLADLGLQPPATWDELLALCDALRDDGRAAFTSSGAWSPPTARYFTILDLRLNGAGFHEELLRGQHSWHDDRVTAVFDHWREMLDHGCFVDDAPTNDFRAAVDDLATGDAAMWNIGEWVYEFLDAGVHDDLDFFSFPQLDPDVAPAEIALVQGVAVNAGAADPDAAAGLAAHLSSPEVLREEFDALGRVAVDPRIDLPYDDVHARADAHLRDADAIVELLEFSAEPRYATSMLSTFVSFTRSPDELDALLDDLEQVRRSVFAP